MIVVIAILAAFVDAPFLHMHERGIEHESKTLVHVHVGCAHHSGISSKDEAQAIYLDWSPLAVDFWRPPALDGDVPISAPTPTVVMWTFVERPVRIHDPPNLSSPALRGPPA